MAEQTSIEWTQSTWNPVTGCTAHRSRSQVPEYNRIADAHTRRLSVSLEGDLQREGQRWRLMNPRDLALIEDED